MVRYLAVIAVLVLVGLWFAVMYTGKKTAGRPNYVGSSVRSPNSSGAVEQSTREDSAGTPSLLPQPVGAQAGPAGVIQPAAGALPVIPDDRKIAFTATLEVVVPELESAVAKVEESLATHKGYVAKSEVKADASARRLATFSIRVPVESFRKFMKELKALGIADKDQIDSEDKTEEIVDVQARIKNLKAEEEVLNKLLKEAANRIDEVLRLREHIKTNRGEIERADARFSTLSRLTALSTITLTLKEPAKDMKPAAPITPPPPSPEPPTFDERVSQTFGESWDLFKGFMQRVALIGVGATPWLPLIVPIGLVGFFMGRRAWRTNNAAARGNGTSRV